MLDNTTALQIVFKDRDDMTDRHRATLADVPALMQIERGAGKT